MDVTGPEESVKDLVADLYEAIFDVATPLPLFTQYRKIKNWDSVVRVAINTAQGIISALVHYPTDADLTRLMIGGPLGVFPALRSVEFARRWAVTTQQEESIIERISTIVLQLEKALACEQWRRWSLNTMALRRHRRAGDLVVLWSVWLETKMRSSMTPEQV